MTTTTTYGVIITEREDSISVRLPSSHRRRAPADQGGPR